MTVRSDKDDMQAAFVWMQGRMVELLLRHDVAQFEHLFQEWLAPPEQTTDTLDPVHRAVLTRYRRLAVLVYLQKELFESILPRIKRQLSFTAPHTRIVEEPPARGRVDWSRTAAATWRDTPDQPPLLLSTRQRRRHFATPENLLTVVTLLEYQAAVQQQLDHESTTVENQAFRHPLHDIIAACTRELVFPQFAGLVVESTAIVQGVTPRTAETLEQDVVAHLLPGHNSAYDDLLFWRRKFRELRLLDPAADAVAQSMLGSDPDQDNYLYQLWLFYEWGNLLQQRGCLLEWSHQDMILRFTWGDNTDQREYCLQHDRGIPGAPAYWTTDEASIAAPGVRPDFYIWRPDRENPSACVRDDGGGLIWRQPGYVLDAKYYKPRASRMAPSNPVKRMIADLQLTGERHGGLLFAFQGGPEQARTPEEANDLDPDLATSLSQPKPLYEITPALSNAQSSAPDTRVGIWRVVPTPGTGTQVTAVLVALLDTADRALRDRVPVRCHGVFLDTLTATAHGYPANSRHLWQRDGGPITEPLDDLLLCPKPHVAAWRVDIVSHTHDCCADAALCHVKLQPGVKKPERLTAFVAIERAILDASEEVIDSATAAAEATARVRIITQRYADLLQPNIIYYYDWIKDKLGIGTDFDTSPLLGPDQRETLALARFLWEQLDKIQAQNFAGPALLFTGVLEWATQKSLHKKRPTLYTTDGSNVRLGDTLGTLGNCKEYGGTHWPILEQAITNRGYWKEQISPGHTYSFSRWIDAVHEIVPIRNAAAHKAQVDRESFTRLINGLFGSAVSGVGALNGLLLAWVPQGGYRAPTG